MKIHIGPLFVLLIFALQFTLHKINSSKAIQNQNNLGFVLKESNAELNINHIHHNFIPANTLSHIAPWISALGASVAVSDVRHDGFQDVFLNDSSPQNNHILYINNHHGKFEDKTHEFKLDQINFPHPITRALFIDCNKDGYPDLFLQSECPQLLINYQGKYFEDYTKQSGIQKCSSVGVASNVFDYDLDGNLDLIWGSYYSNNLFSKNILHNGILPQNFIDSKNTASLILMKGDGNCHFVDRSQDLPQKYLRGWYFTIGIQDIFQNGRQDLWIASDFGIDQVFSQKINSTKWENKSFMVNHPSRSKNGMGVNFSDVSHQRKPFIYTSNIFQVREKISGNLMWTYEKNKNIFNEVSREYNNYACGWSWGSQFIDLNMDGWDDLVVTNGFFGDGKKKSYWYNLSVLDSSGKNFMSDIRNWPDMKNYDLEGSQQDCIFLNRGKENRFSNITQLLPAFDKDKKNGRGISYIDINNDGNYSLIVANQNDIAHLYKITQTTRNHHWFGLSLVGTKSNISGYGTKIYWELSDGTQSYKEMRSINGYASQNDPRFRLGIPSNIYIKNLYLLWPSGYKQILNMSLLPMNKYHTITEGKEI